MPTFKIQGIHRTYGYRSPIMLVDAESESKAMNATRLHDFQDDWTIVINHKTDGSARRIAHPVNKGIRAAKRKRRHELGMPQHSRPVRRRLARMESKRKSYKADSEGRRAPGCAKHW